MPPKPPSKAQLREMLEAELARLRGALEAADGLRDKVDLTEEDEALFAQIKAHAKRLEREVKEAMTDH